MKWLCFILLLWVSPALAQPVQCPDRPSADSSNACANTRFVQDHGGGGGGAIPYTDVTSVPANTYLGNNTGSTANAIAIPIPSVLNTRVRLLVNTDFYVNSSTGNDANDCLGTGTACQTLQHVTDLLRQSYDFGCKIVKVRLMVNFSGPGATMNGNQPGQCDDEDYEILGDDTGTLATAGSPLNRSLTSGVILQGGARAKVRGVYITNASGPCLSADSFSYIRASFIDFGPTSTYHIVAGVYSRAKMVGSYTIRGGGNGHANAAIGQFQIIPGVIAIFIVPGITFSTAFILADENAVINITYNPGGAPSAKTQFWNSAGLNCGQFVPCANGQRWGASFMSLIFTNGSGAADPYYLPGNAPGSASADSVFN